MRVIGTWILCAGAAWTAAAFLLFVVQNRLLYFPIRELDCEPSLWGLPFEEALLEADDGTQLHGWWIPPPMPDAGAPVVLFCHGNAGNISHRGDTARILHDLGAGVLLFDYRGYGRSDGRPSETGLRRDARAAWRHLVEARGVTPERIVLFGRSLGAAVAAALAAEVRPRALILESAFTSVPDLARRYFPIFPVRLLVRNRHDTRAALGRIACPVLVVHSRDDEMIPYRHGKALFDTARGCGVDVEFLEIRGSHNEGFLRTGDLYTEGLRRFLERLD